MAPTAPTSSVRATISWHPISVVTPPTTVAYRDGEPFAVVELVAGTHYVATSVDGVCLGTFATEDQARAEVDAVA